MRLRFGRCLLDTDAHELIRDGVRQGLSPKAFQLLDLLLRARPRAMTKQEIHDALWPKHFVSDSSLPRLAAEVRSAIGDDAKSPRLLRTVHRYGYAFFGAVAAAEGEGAPLGAPFRVVWGERQIVLLAGENVIGRAPDARILVDLARVSRRHARIVVTDGRAVLEDLGSKNGTFLRGERLTQPRELADGDEIWAGSLVLVFRSSLGETTETGTGR